MRSAIVKHPAIMIEVLLCFTWFALPAAAACRKARPDEIPHGANEFVQLKDQTVDRVFGTVLLSNEPAGDIVVEVFRYRGGADYQEMKQALQEARISACVTKSDGTFSFPKLKPGRYLLRAGAPYLRGDQ